MELQTIYHQELREAMPHWMHRSSSAAQKARQANSSLIKPRTLLGKPEALLFQILSAG